MSQVDCPSCGAEITVSPETGSDELSLTCPGCQARLRIQVTPDPSGLGLATIFQPQLLSEGFTETEIVHRSRLGSGTIVLDPEESRQMASPMDLKLRAHLVIVGDPTGRQHPLVGPKTIVGREGADITIEDPTLSSRHFELEVRGEEFFIRDLDSSNGTLLNGESIRTAEVSSGDKIRAGQTTFILHAREVIPWDRS